MDTKHIENIAEDLIAHFLQRNGLLVAKPKFDRQGTDLIALMEVDDGSKFCRIQCKGRSLIKSNRSNITIPEEYVKGAFWVFLYVDVGLDNPYLFGFSTKDIIDFWQLKMKIKSNKYYYYLFLKREIFIKNTSKNNLFDFIVSNKTIPKLKEAINRSVSKNEIEIYNLKKSHQKLLDIKDKIHELKSLNLEQNYIKKLLESRNETTFVLQENIIDKLLKTRSKLYMNLKQRINQLLKEQISIDNIVVIVRDITPSNIPSEILRAYIERINETT